MAEKQFTEKEKEDLKKAFDQFDKNGNGSITKKEFKKALRGLGQNPTKAELKALFKGYDTDGNRKIEFPEFLTMMTIYLSTHDNPKQELQDAFKVFDKDGNGVITAEELRKAMKNLGKKLTDAEVDEMIGAADVDGDGCINYEEFTKFMMSDSTTKQATDTV